jgi:hypothetical protein
VSRPVPVRRYLGQPANASFRRLSAPGDDRIKGRAVVRRVGSLLRALLLTAEASGLLAVVCPVQER